MPRPAAARQVPVTNGANQRSSSRPTDAMPQNIAMPTTDITEAASCGFRPFSRRITGRFTDDPPSTPVRSMNTSAIRQKVGERSASASVAPCAAGPSVWSIDRGGLRSRKAAAAKMMVPVATPMTS